MALDLNIQKITVGSSDYELNARYWNGHEWSELGHAIKFIGKARLTEPTAGSYKKGLVYNKDDELVETYYIPLTETGTKTRVALEKGDVFVYLTTAKEFICVTADEQSGTTFTDGKCYELGDESSYQLIGKTLTSSGPSNDATSSAGAQTVTAASAGSQTATGTATVTYKKSDAATGSAGGATLNTGNAGAATITSSSAGGSTHTHTFTGTAATINVSADAVTLDDHSYQPAGSVSAVSAASHTHTVTPNTATVQPVTAVDANTGEAGAHTHSVSVSGNITLDDLVVSKAASGTVTYTPEGTVSKPNVSLTSSAKTVVSGISSVSEAAAHSHTVDSHEHAADVTAVGSLKTGSAYQITGVGTLPSLTVTDKTVVSDITVTKSGSIYMTSPTVESNVLKWTLAAAVTDVSASTTSVGSASGWSAGSSPTRSSFTYVSGASTTVTAAGASSAATLTSSSAGAHTHTVTPSTISINHVTAAALSATPTFTGTGARLLAAGATVSGSMSGTAESAGAHSHSIGSTKANTITYVTGIKSVSSAGAFTVTPTFTGTTATIAHSFTDSTTAASMSGSYTPGGTLTTATISAHTHSVTVANHSHSVTIADHTHSIGLTDTTITGTASVAVSAHTHSVTIASHTHSLNNHTHTVTTSNN